MTTQLEPQDPDLQLAQRLGHALQQDQQAASIDDPLIQLLATSRGRRKQQVSWQHASSEALWKRIHNEMQAGSVNSEAKTTRVFPINAMRWAAAALVLLASLAGIYYFGLQQSPALVAEAGSTLKTVQLQDGSLATLRPHSELYKISESPELESYQLDGEAFFDVTQSPSRKFQVQAGEGRVTVLGTQFVVSDWGEITQVFLQEGSVQFSGRQNVEPLVLEPGQAARLSDTSDRPVLVDESAREATDWMQNELVFEEQPADQVLRELEQHYNITLQASSTLRRETLSGSISLENQQKALEYLALSLGAEIIKHDEQSYELKSTTNADG